MRASQIFKKWDRVKMTDAAYESQLAGRSDNGTVVGFSRDLSLVKVLRDGTSTPLAYNPIFWQVQASKLTTATQKPTQDGE